MDKGLHRARTQRTERREANDFRDICRSWTPSGGHQYCYKVLPICTTSSCLEARATTSDSWRRHCTINGYGFFRERKLFFCRDFRTLFSKGDTSRHGEGGASSWFSSCRAGLHPDEPDDAVDERTGVLAAGVVGGPIVGIERGGRGSFIQRFGKKGYDCCGG